MIDTVTPFPGRGPEKADVRSRWARIAAIVALAAVLALGGAWTWYGAQPIDLEQRTILKAMVHEVAKREGVDPQRVWAGLKKRHRISRYADLERRDYDDTLDRLLERATPR